MIQISDIKSDQEKIQKVFSNIELVFKGKREPILYSIIALLSKGHILFEDVPGVGKTTLARAIARSIGCTFKKIQFTSDLLPSDIIGVSIYNEKEGKFKFERGPIFTNILLADEINRSTPRTQSALLEAMSEFQVTVDRETYSLPSPFLLMATQNPKEHYGTYPLPESQLDRFLITIVIGYPEREFEEAIMMDHGYHEVVDKLQPVITTEDITKMIERVKNVYVSKELQNYVLDIIEETRRLKKLEIGVSPRGAIFLYKSAQAMAYINGRDYCVPYDFKSLFVPIFSHRVVLTNHSALGENVREITSAIIQEIVDKIPVPDGV